MLIVQDDNFEETASITVCLLTTHSIDAGLVRPAIEASTENGLREPSYVMVDKITTMPRARLGQEVGRLKDADMLRLNRAILVFLGLAGQTRG